MNLYKLAPDEKLILKLINENGDEFLAGHNKGYLSLILLADKKMGSVLENVLLWDSIESLEEWVNMIKNTCPDVYKDLIQLDMRITKVKVKIASETKNHLGITH
jgi:hypothetical protein